MLLPEANNLMHTPVREEPTAETARSSLLIYAKRYILLLGVPTYCEC
jgi:hypothetical protein